MMKFRFLILVLSVMLCGCSHKQSDCETIRFTTWGSASEIAILKPIISDFEQKTILEGAISEEKYNNLCNYVLADVGLEGGTVLNATKFAGTGDGSGRNRTILTVLYNNKIATVDARCHSGLADDNGSIDYMLSSETNDIRITSYEDYKDFDYLNNEASMSAVSYNLNLGGKTIATKTASGTTFNMNCEDFCQ